MLLQVKRDDGIFFIFVIQSFNYAKLAMPFRFFLFFSLGAVLNGICLILRITVIFIFVRIVSSFGPCQNKLITI